eukprot:TRINITY_DN2629_c0_g1_i1.p1 TRINITY_DN2629_c0_g1~~TRINITY_DN2629_c0_g1_i1.p1  ORF type:complete len:428 (+),score=87.03 TRINITY_DN2629_c0_g1_i1:149-1432(+)
MRVWVVGATTMLAVALLVLGALELRRVGPTVGIIAGAKTDVKISTVVSEQVEGVRSLMRDVNEIKDSLETVIRYLKENKEAVQHQLLQFSFGGAEGGKQERKLKSHSTKRKRHNRKQQKKRRKQQKKVSNPTVLTRRKETTLGVNPSPPEVLPTPLPSKFANPNTMKKPGAFLKHRNDYVPGDTPRCMSQPLMLMSKQRSGFHFFRSLLDQHPKSRMGTEYFCRHVVSYRPTYGELFLEKLTLTPDEAKAYLEQEMLDKYYTAFTFQNGQQVEDFPFVPSLVKEMGFVAIHLVRKNILAIALSGVFDKLTHQPVCLVGETCKALEVKATVNVTRLYRELQRIKFLQENNRELLNAAGLKWTEIVYEDLARNNTKICDALEFLGCGCPPLTTGTVQKIIQKPFSELISNWDELVDKLKGTEFEVYLSS